MKPQRIQLSCKLGTHCHGADGSHSCDDLLKKRIQKLETIVGDIERRILWALRFMRCPGSGMVAFKNPVTGKYDDKLIHWTTWFADALELSGNIKVDRELLGKTERQRYQIIRRREQEAKAAEKI